MNFLQLQQSEVSKLKRIYNDLDSYNAEIERKKKELFFLKKLDTILPFVVATTIVFGGNVLANKNPFVLEEEKTCVKKCTIERDGEVIFTKKALEEYLLPSKGIEYSTAFEINEDGLYERQFTIFKTEALSNYTKEELYGMTREELEQVISVKEKGSIKKRELNEDDLLYTEDGLYLTTVYDDVDDYFFQQETFWENLLEIVGIFLKSGVFGFGIYSVKKIISKDYIKVKLDGQISSLKVISRSDLSRVKEMIKIRENNLSLFKEDDADD